MSKHSAMRIAMLSTCAWRTPPRRYGPWEQIVSLLTEGLMRRGHEVTLFATSDSITSANLQAVCPVGYREDQNMEEEVWKLMHIANTFEQANKFDIIHNQFDYQPLTYSRLVSTPVVTTIHGFSSPLILPAYQKYNENTFYVSISNANRHPALDYVATVYHRINLDDFTFRDQPDDYLLFFGRLDHEKGVYEAIQVAKQMNRRLLIAGIISDEKYFQTSVAPHLDNDRIQYIGNIGPKERNQLLGGAQALLHLINFDEPFGLSIVEAMACGTPVIAMERGSMPELIQDNKTGFLVQNNQEAAAAVKRISKINRADCRTHVEKYFSSDRMVDNYIAVYQNILKQSSKVPQ